MGLRDRYVAFIARHEVAWEVAMALLAVVFVAVGFLADDAAPAYRGPLLALDDLLTLLFVAEFGSRFLASRDRRAYLRGHWLDLVALIPTIRGVRVLRLLRLLRLVRAFAGLYRALGHAERLVGHRGLGMLVVAWLGVMVVCSLALYAAEQGVNEAVSSPLDALWWGVVTLTTVGYGDVYPVTPEGRVAATVLMLLGIGLFGAITATVTSFVLSSDRQDSTSHLDVIRAIGRLRDEGLLTPDEFESKKRELLERV